MPNAKTSGLLIIGHGSREPQAVCDFLALVDEVAGMVPGIAVEPCFLELAEPTIPMGVGRLAGRGCRRIDAMPLLLFAAGHARRDIPNALRESAAEHPGIELHQLPHLGCHPRILALSTERYRETVSLSNSSPPMADYLVLVGRGSRDPRATAEMRQFAELRRHRTPVTRLEIGFLALERPSLIEAVNRAGTSGMPRIVVQPHLLLAGLLMNQLRIEVDRARRQWPQSEWLVTEPLGPGPLLAQAVVEILLAGHGLQNMPAPLAVNQIQSTLGEPAAAGG